MSFEKIQAIYRSLHVLPDWFFQLFARIAIAPVFWISGQNKVSGSFPDYSLSGTTKLLFRDDWALPFIPPLPAAYLATFAEHVFPVLLVLGLFTRFAALSLFLMTMVIQIFIYPDAWWNTHIIWVFPLFYVMARGPGAVSLDALILRSFEKGQREGQRA